MSDEQQFEARFEAAFGRYLEGAPVEVDPAALTRAITAASPPTGARRFLTMITTLRLVLLAAVLATVSLAVGLSAGQNVTPQPGCATPLPSTPTLSTATASPTETGVSPVQFLWSATGLVDDPMGFAVSVSNLAAGGRVAVDPGCRVWVADTGHDRFAIFDSNGSFIEYWGSPGSGEGQFKLRNSSNDGLGDIAFAPDGSFYVLDVGNERVQHFDRDRTFLGSWGGAGSAPGQYTQPDGIAVDGKGLVHVLDVDALETYDKDGNVVGSFSPHLSDAQNGMALDEQGNIYIAACCGAGNEILKFAPDGSGLATIGSLGSGDSRNPQMTAVAVDAAGRVFAVATGPAVTGDRVRVYDPDGTFLASFGGGGSGDGQFGSEWILGIALDGNGNVYLTDPGQNRVEKFRLLSPLAP